MLKVNWQALLGFILFSSTVVSILLLALKH